MSKESEPFAIARQALSDLEDCAVKYTSSDLFHAKKAEIAANLRNQAKKYSSQDASTSGADMLEGLASVIDKFGTITR